MTYTINYRRSVAKDLRKITKSELIQITKKISGLAENPRPAGYVKLIGSENFYRIRHGDYRIIYEIFDTEIVVLIIKVGHRSQIYR